MIGWPRNGPQQVADEEHPHAAMFIEPGPHLAADEPIDEAFSLLGILHVRTQPPRRRPSEILVIAMVNIWYRTAVIAISGRRTRYERKGLCARQRARSRALPASRPASASSAGHPAETSSMLWLAELDAARHAGEPGGAEIAGHALEAMRRALGTPRSRLRRSPS